MILRIKDNTPRVVRKLVAGRIYTFYRDSTPTKDYEFYVSKGFDIFELGDTPTVQVKASKESIIDDYSPSKTSLNKLTLQELKDAYKGLYEPKMTKAKFIDKILKHL